VPRVRRDKRGPLPWGRPCSVAGLASIVPVTA
jgi:hypothetical protein